VTCSLTETKTKSTGRSKNSGLQKWLTGMAAIAICGAVFSASVTDANAQRRNKQQEEAAAEGRQFGAKAGEIVNKALEAMNANKNSEALNLINKALALPNLNPYEKSTIYQMQGQVNYELNRYPDAIRSFENAISAGGLLPKEKSNLRLNIAQLLIASGQPARGAQMMEDWARNGGKLKPKHIEYLWQAWSQAEQYDRALPWAEKWFNNANPKERKHFDLLNFLYNNLHMPGKQADIVKQMIVRWPEDLTLWNTWKSMLANGGREQEAFEVTKMLYLGGALTKPKDLEQVVQYYGYYEMPYQAAEILKREMNRGRIPQTSEKLVQLSNLYRQAREYKKAIPVLEKAAQSAGSAKLFADLGEALFNEGSCDKAEKAFKKAMNLGYDKGKSWMLIANCRYDQAAKEPRPKCTKEGGIPPGTQWEEKRKQAIAAFDNVPSSSSEARNARKWKTFILAEKKAVVDRCVFKVNLREQQCFADIRRAKKAEFLDGKFKLTDPTCQEFVPAWEKLYEQKIGAKKKG